MDELNRSALSVVQTMAGSWLSRRRRRASLSLSASSARFRSITLATASPTQLCRTGRVRRPFLPPHTLTDTQQLMILGDVIHSKLKKAEVALRFQGKLITGMARQFWKDEGK